MHNSPFLDLLGYLTIGVSEGHAASYEFINTINAEEVLIHGVEENAVDGLDLRCYMEKHAQDQCELINGRHDAVLDEL